MVKRKKRGSFPVTLIGEAGVGLSYGDITPAVHPADEAFGAFLTVTRHTRTRTWPHTHTRARANISPHSEIEHP